MSVAVARRAARILLWVALGTFAVTVMGVLGADVRAGRHAAVLVGVAGGALLVVTLIVSVLAAAASAAPGQLDGDVVRVGSEVLIVDPRTGRRVRYTILPDEQAAVAPDALPVSSPVARALLGARPDDTVDVVERTLRVDEVIPPEGSEQEA
jgi:Transcription elongation factor, GreA/GreB, C-term